MVFGVSNAKYLAFDTPDGSALRATTSVDAKKISFYTSKTYFFYFTLLFLQNTYIILFIIHIYSNKIFISLTLSSLSQT